MNTRHISQPIREAAVADYYASGDSAAVVAARHGIARSTFSAWVTRDRGVGLSGGRWVPNSRGVQVWESFAPRPAEDDYLTDHQRLVKHEEDMFTEEEARTSHARYAYGLRDPRTVMGERVYNRRKKRTQTARKAAA